MDTWEGRDHDPKTLHKYVYTESDPVNNIDSSGNITLPGISAFLKVRAIMTTASVKTGRRVKGSLGIVVVFHNKRPLFALDLKTGKAWSKSQLKKRSARFGNIPIVQVLGAPSLKKK